jgi:SAM-dependent methyltransferase
MKKTSWEQVAAWYDGWVGKEGSYYHRTIAIPRTLELLNLQPNEFLLDVGAGTGTLAPHVLKTGCNYIGLELSHLQTHLQQRFDAAVFLLSVQDMEPLEAVFQNVHELLRARGRIVIFMIHPCFRIPRQSGWGFDEQRKLHYRRIDRYLSSLVVPMKTFKGHTTHSYHRPLQSYVEALVKAGFYIDGWQELADTTLKPNGQKNPNEDIPLFLALRAYRKE